jgi:hypothetical protein
MVGADDVKVAVTVGVNVKLGVCVWVGVDISSIFGVGEGKPVFSGPPVAVITMNCGLTADRVATARLQALPANIKTAIGNHRTNWKMRTLMIFSLPAETGSGVMRWKSGADPQAIFHMSNIALMIQRSLQITRPSDVLRRYFGDFEYSIGKPQRCGVRGSALRFSREDHMRLMPVKDFLGRWGTGWVILL